MKPLHISFKWNRHKRPVILASITAALRYGSREKYLTLPIRIEATQWDNKKQVVKNHADAVRLNLILNQMKSKANSYHLDKILNNEHFSLVNLRNHLKGHNEGDFITFVSDNLKSETKLAQSTLKQHRILLKYLQAYSVNIPFSSMDFNFVAKFESFLLDQTSYRDKTQTLGRNYIATMLTILKKYTRLAVLHEKIKQDPFLGFSIKRTKTTKIELTLKEIAALMKVDVSKRRGNVEVSRDAFIFSCFTGLRYSDIFGSKNGSNYGLKVKHFLPTPNGYRLQKQTQKTGSILDIPLNLLPFDGIPQQIAEKYIKGKKANDFVFGTVTPNSFNDSIRSISKIAGIDKHITSHTARHSFSTNLQEKGVPLKVISALVGHSSVKTTEVYAKTNANTIDNILKTIK